MVTRPDRPGVAGRTRLGCLFSVLLLAVAVYYVAHLGPLWWRYWEIQDRMKVVAKYAVDKTDEEIHELLVKDAEEIGLPPDARRFRIVRGGAPKTISISITYFERVNLPLVHRSFAFHPVANQPL